MTFISKGNMPIQNADIVDVISQSLKLPREAVTPELRYHDMPAWDSLGHIYLITELERHFNIHIPNDTIYSLSSVGVICDYIKNKKHHRPEQQPLKTTEVHRGLKDVYFDETSISSIDAEASRISYREYDLAYLVERHSYEETLFLMICERLPSKEELQVFLGELFLLKEETHSFFVERYKENIPKEQHLAVLELILYLNNSVSATMPVHPHTVYGSVLLFVCLLNGYEYEEELTIDTLLQNTFRLDSRESGLLKKCLMLLMEHGANAGAFSLRVSASTGNNFILSLCSSVITFCGNKHGGAIGGITDFIEQLKGTSSREWFLEMCIRNNINIPGFGHRLYKKEDPRVVQLSKLIDMALAERKSHEYYVLCIEVLSILEKYKPYGLIPNVDFFTSILFHLLGLPKESFLTLFIASRIPGLIAHFNEQRENNILIRPNLKYNGKPIIS